MADRHSEQDGDVLSPETQTEPNGVPFDTVVIVGRGGYGAAPRQELERLGASVARAGSFRAVRYAFLGQGQAAPSGGPGQWLAA
ncbi:MAG: hypothetical protein OXE05_13940, partial [Chloroflexi bacterium]|nr:hypothetical protein [Chloroflexota bacterium]